MHSSVTAGRTLEKQPPFGAPDIAKFHYTDPTRTRPDPHGPARTFFAAKLRWVRAGRRQSPVGSGRVRVVEFSSYPTTCADFVRVRSVSGPCSGI